MKRLAILLTACLALGGCKKAMKDIEDDTKVGKDEQPRIVPKGTGNLSVQGGEGATQATRKASARTTNFNNLSQLQKMIVAAEIENGRMPSAQDIREALRQAGQILAAVDDGIIILTDSTDRGGIWAYTQWPQRGGDHYAVKAAGVEPMSPDALAQALQAQGSEVKLSK
jgi:hypothetical protein